MYNLLLKDILIQKRILLFGIAYILVMAFSFQSSGEGMFISGVVAFVYMLTQTACAYDDRNKSDIMLNSLPLTRANIVTERYISIFAFLAIAIIEYVILRFVVNSLGFLGITMFPITLTGLFGAMFAIVLMSSLYFPIFFKVGYVKAKMINFILFFGVFFSIIPVIGILKQYENNPAAKKLVEFANSISYTQFAVGGVVIILVMLYISYALSVYFYRNRDF